MPGTPVGTVNLWATDRGLRRLDFTAGRDLARPGERLGDAAPPGHLATAQEQLGEYFAGRRETFDVPLDPGPVTAFQRRVYDRLLAIPFGHVVSYGDVAKDIGASAAAAARAVGQAVGANPLAILIPCHRVLSSRGRLHGYGGGLRRKACLLRLEGLQVEGARASSPVRADLLSLPL